MIVYDYTPTRSRAGPAKFLEGYKGYLQADAYSVYDAFFKPQRGMTEVGLRIPMMSISHSDLMPIRTERSDAGLSQCEIVIDIRQEFCWFSMA